MIRRLLNFLAALSMLMVLPSGTCSCTGKARPLPQADRAELASRSASAPAAADKGTPAWVEVLVGAIRNDQLVWEIEWPTPDTHKDLVVGPHYSPRGKAGSPVDVLAPWHPWDSGFYPFRPERPPLAVEQVAGPLLKALHDPDRWIAAHVILTHILLRGRGDTEQELRRQWLRDYNLKEYYGWPPEDFGPGDDGIYRYYFNGVRADLTPQGPERPFDYGGSYGGKFTVRAASARIDPKQMAETRQWWAQALKPVLERTPEPKLPQLEVNCSVTRQGRDLVVVAAVVNRGPHAVLVATPSSPGWSFVGRDGRSEMAGGGSVALPRTFRLLEPSGSTGGATHGLPADQFIRLEEVIPESTARAITDGRMTVTAIVQVVTGAGEAGVRTQTDEPEATADVPPVVTGPTSRPVPQ